MNDLKKKLFTILADNFRFNDYGEYTQISEEQINLCVNEILEVIGNIYETDLNLRRNEK